jgi:hypothetical protein
VVSLGGCDVSETELTAGFGFDFGGRKNELPGDRFGLGLDVMVTVFHFHLQEIAFGYGCVEFGLPLGLAFGLEGFEFAQGFFERALEALFVEAQVEEGFVIVAETRAAVRTAWTWTCSVSISPASSEWPSESMASSSERARLRRHWVSQKV